MTLFVADDRRTRLLRGRSIALLFISHGLFSAGERAGGRLVPRSGRTKASPENSARAEWALSRAPSLFLAVCKRARYNAASAAAVPTCCCLVRVAPTRWPRAASNIRSPTTDNCRCSSEICDLSVIYRLPRRTGVRAIAGCGTHDCDECEVLFDERYRYTKLTRY